MSKTVPCPHCGKRINPAKLLGHLNAGGKKVISEKEREARRQRMAHARKFRRPEPESGQ